jgi:benzoyl-CoA reductase/2-hydroxyglutaryl-CoA dehydratase subunit BcrC/BadD/HgdB
MDLHPVRLMSDDEEPVRTNEFLQGFCCPYAKNLLEQALKNKLNFLSAVIFTRYCDSLRGVYEVWKSEKLSPLVEFIRYSQAVRDTAKDYLVVEFKEVFDRVKRFLGCNYSFDSLKDAISKVNKKRMALQRLYSMRKEGRLNTSSEDFYKVVFASTWKPIENFIEDCNNLTSKNGVIENNLDDRKIVLSATELDNLRFFKMLDEIGFFVVSDDIASGTRYAKDLVKEDGNNIDDLIENIAIRYIMKPPCSVKDPSDRRIDELIYEVKSSKARGVIFFRTRFCDSEGIEYAFIKRRLEKEAIPHIYIESDHRLSNLQQLRTRLEAFYEQIVGIV